MRVPRLKWTVRRLMVAIAIIAVDFALIRAADGSNGYPHGSFLVLPALVLVPSLSLLIVAAISVGLGLMRRREAPPFSTGYLLLGGMASFGVGLALAAQMYDLFVVETVRVVDPVQESSDFGYMRDTVLAIAVYALPQVTPALIGGGLAARYGLTIVLKGRLRFPEGARIETLS